MCQRPGVGLTFEFTEKLSAGSLEAGSLPGITWCLLGPEHGPSGGRGCRKEGEGKWGGQGRIGDGHPVR